MTRQPTAPPPARGRTSRDRVVFQYRAAEFRSIASGNRQVPAPQTESGGFTA